MRISDPCGHRWTKFFFFLNIYTIVVGFVFLSLLVMVIMMVVMVGALNLFIYGNPFQREREKGMTATTLFSRPVRLKTGQDKVSSLGFMQYDRFL